MNDRRNDVALSERYRLAALQHARLDGAAGLLEELKTAFLSKRKMALGDMADNKAERQIKASAEWEDYIRKMVAARTAANEARVEATTLQMQHREWIAADANARAERKM
jgi:hypothetical protein